MTSLRRAKVHNGLSRQINLAEPPGKREYADPDGRSSGFALLRGKPSPAPEPRLGRPLLRGDPQAVPKPLQAGSAALLSRHAESARRRDQPAAMSFFVPKAFAA